MKIKLWRRLQVKGLLPVTEPKTRPLVIREQPEEVIFALCYMTMVTLIQVPFEEIDGSRVPIFLFKGQPSIYHAFLMSLMFAFSGAISAMTGRDDCPKVASFCRRLAVVSVSVSAVIFLWVAVFTGFRWILNLSLIA